MGQEILYCFKCQERITTADLDSANALRFGTRSACKKCVPDLIASLSPKEQQELVARVQTPERRTGSGLTPRVRPAQTTRRRTQASPVPWWVLAGAGVAAVVVAGVIVASSGSPDPNREIVAKPPAPRPPEESPRERSAREALAKAKAVPSSNREGQIAAFAEAMKATGGTSYHREAKEMHEGLLDLRRKALVRELSAVEERARATVQKEEFGAAISIYEAIRPLHPGADWRSLVDAKVDEVRRTVDAAYGPLQEKAAQAKATGSEDEVKAIRDRVVRWGLAEKTAALDAHLQSIAAPAVSRPWIPLFDGKSLSFLSGDGEGGWRVENGAIVLVKGKELAAQTRRVFVDAEIRVRFEHRDLTNMGFTFRQGSDGSYSIHLDRARLKGLEGGEHELVIRFKGTELSAKLDGSPLSVETFGKPSAGHFQFNAQGERFVVKALEVREDSESVGLAGYWRMDVVDAGTAQDASGNRNTAGLVDNPVPVPGKIGNALQFDGRRSHVTVPSSATINPTGPFSISAWLKPVLFEGAARAIVEKWDGDDPAARTGFMFRLSAKNQTHFGILGPDGDTEVTGATAVPADVWSCVTAVFDGSSVRVYFNGVLERNVPCPRPPRASRGALQIGKGGGGGGLYFSGIIDDVRFYNRALTADEILRLAK